MTPALSGLPSDSDAILDLGSDSPLLARRLRHITSIQVRNLTPFPVRDAFTSALFQQVESLNPASSTNDDLNIIPSRRRARKVSANSVATRSSLKWEDAFHEEDTPNVGSGSSTIRGRKTSASRVNFAAVGEELTSVSPRTKIQRPRTNSKASSTSSRAQPSLFNTNSSIRTSSFLPDHSQKGLEKVIDSRLLETCLVITVIEHPPAGPSGDNAISPKTAGLPSPTQTVSSAKQLPKSAPPTKNHFRTYSAPRQASGSNPFRSPSPEINSLEPQDTQSDPRRTRFLPPANGKPKVFPSTTPQGKIRPKLSQLTESQSIPGPQATVLTYRSPIHRPSTNPRFLLSVGLVPQSQEWVHLNAQSFKTTIWGKLPADVQRTGWDTQLTPPYPDEPGYHWRVIQEWDVHLGDLEALPENVHSSDLPSNTFLLTLGPHDRTYCIPGQAHVVSRPSTPSTGYASDPESELHKVKRLTSSSSTSDPHGRRRRRGVRDGDSKEVAKTATWPDLFQLATTQALIYDNDASLRAISAKVDHLVLGDELTPLNRQISERQCRVAELNENLHQVLETCADKRSSIRERAELLQRRREMLTLARQVIGDAEEAESLIADRVDEERSQLSALHISMSSIRSNLIAILSEIFPIELYSPADLLFTILDVALPLPVSAKDPAPPLTVPEHKDITEDSVATALGYVAQVLQILAAYLGTTLLYPVTCIGSRSLIRDNISAMIGPRMFPLYSKGVDTYRFEYGVFLLNKNIEMLMVDKDLRALDMRHTLPNLKNLLLILSHESSRSEVPKSKIPDPSSSSLSLLSLDSQEMNEDGETRTSNGRGEVPSDRSGDLHTPPCSGSTTPIPTPVSDESRKSRFLALAPFTGFLRSRYPSTSRASTKSVHESGGVQDEEGGDGDTSTIHGLVREVEVEDLAGREAKQPVEGLPEPKAQDRNTSLPASMRTETS